MNSESSRAILMNSSELKELIKFSQIIPEGMMAVIQKMAGKNGTSIDLEVSSRLLATFIYPEVFGLESFQAQLLSQKVSTKAAFQECKDRREKWIYPYEMAKLRLFLEFKSKLPRNFKEHFTKISVQAATKGILEEVKNKNSGKESDD